MTKSGSLVPIGNEETDKQITKYRKNQDVTVKMRLWFCAITGSL